MRGFFKILRYLFFLGLGCFCAALVFEVYLRAVEQTYTWKAMPVAEVSLYGPDIQTAYAHRTDVSGIWTTENRARVSTTNFGVRANGLEEENVVKDHDVLKIGVVGDSIVEALQVNDDETFSAILEQKLRTSGKQARIYNLGLAGATPVIKALRAEKYAKDFDLDLIIVIEDPYSISQTLGSSDGGRLPHYKINQNGDVIIDQTFRETRGFQFRNSDLGGLVYFFLNNSKLLTVLNTRFNRGIFEELKQQVEQVPDKTKPKIKDLYKCDHESISILADINEAQNRKTLKMLGVFAKQLLHIETEHETEIIFAFYNTWPDCPSSLENVANENIRKLLEAQNIEFLNLKSEIRDVLPGAYDLNHLRGFGASQGKGHLNVKGHEIFSQALGRYIMSHY
ncbi:MAG: hypothetical protein R3E13_02830 [Alphaproteobacteria bacterium]